MEKWSGQFNTISPGTASGQIKVDLKTDENGSIQTPEYTTPFRVIYNGLYRAGQIMNGSADVQEGKISATLPPF